MCASLPPFSVTPSRAFVNCHDTEARRRPEAGGCVDDALAASRTPCCCMDAERTEPPVCSASIQELQRRRAHGRPHAPSVLRPSPCLRVMAVQERTRRDRPAMSRENAESRRRRSRSGASCHHPRDSHHCDLAVRSASSAFPQFEARIPAQRTAAVALSQRARRVPAVRRATNDGDGRRRGARPCRWPAARRWTARGRR